MAGPVPSAAQRPIASFSGLAWALSLFALGVICGFTSQVVLMGVCFIAAIVGIIPTRERPLYLHLINRIWFGWKQWRMGTTWRREISSTQMVLRRGVTQLKGMFKIELVALEFKTATGYYQIPAFLNRNRHTIIVECGTNPNSALADRETRLEHEAREASVYSDLAYQLGEGNSFTVWALRREVDRAPIDAYLDERVEGALQDDESDSATRIKGEMQVSHDEILKPNWQTRRGISLTATNPSSWKTRRLDKLSDNQLRESAAVMAALIAEDKLTSAGISDARVTSFPQFKLLLREIFSVRDLDAMRKRVLEDKIDEDVAEMEGQRVDPKKLFSADETPLPTMQREMGNDFLLFDGTYHRVTWVTNYFDSERDDPAAFDHLYTAPCNYYVGIYADLKRADQDDSDRQDRGRISEQLLELRKRNKSASDEKSLTDLDAERYDVMRYGQYAAYFRTLVIFSATSYEGLKECQDEFRAHLNQRSIRVDLHTVYGGDQLPWFFAAMGSFGG